MDRARDRDDRFAVFDEAFGFGRVLDGGRIGEPRVRLAQPVEVADVFRRGDERDDHRRAERRLADLAHRDFLARRVELLKITGDLRPVGDRPVVGRLKTEHRARRRRVLRERGRREEQDKNSDEADRSANVPGF